MKLLTTTILCHLLVSYGILHAQMHDLNWLFGYGGLPVGDKLGIVKINFESGNPEQTEIGEAIYEFYGNTSVFSDSSGRLFAYFNGFDLNNAQSNVMENGKKFDVDLIKFDRYLSDNAFPQGSLFIQWPGHPDSILMLYAGEAWIPQGACVTKVCQNLSYAIIDRKPNNGLGRVVAREQNIMDDTINHQVTLCKHANGRDWWLPVSERNSNRYTFFLIDPNGIRYSHIQTVDSIIHFGLGQSVFSPDGRCFATFNALGLPKGNHISVFDFDRCSGYLTNQKSLFIDGYRFGGLAISPNSRFLYVGLTDTLFQYDLKSPDLATSRKTIKVREPYPGTIFQPNYFTLGLAPDQRIYMSGTNSMLQLHVINNPDEEGIACDFQERGYKLLTNNCASMPNFPNYRLGPLDGSPCDTLGLDNLPRAWWRSDRDSTNVLRRSFHDLSFYEPQSWAWDFGDPASGVWNSSTERHPQHVFSKPGKYEICLKVKNGNGEHTFCRTLFLGITGVEEVENEGVVRVWPNPVRDVAWLDLAPGLAPARLRLHDVTGRVLLDQPLAEGLNCLDMSGLSAGIYFYEMVFGSEAQTSGFGSETQTSGTRTSGGSTSGRVVKIE